MVVTKSRSQPRLYSLPVLNNGGIGSVENHPRQQSSSCNPSQPPLSRRSSFLPLVVLPPIQEIKTTLVVRRISPARVPS
jgi:hypothetical protein